MTNRQLVFPGTSMAVTTTKVLNGRQINKGAKPRIDISLQGIPAAAKEKSKY
jgi:hypothetical protein